MIAALSLCSGVSVADAFFVSTDHDVILKYQAWSSLENSESSGMTHSLTMMFEEKTCYKYKFCYNPYFIHITNDAGRNAGLGIDIKHGFLKSKGNNMYISGGAVVFNEKLNGNDGEHLNFHVGAGLEVGSLVFSADAYANKSHDHNNDSTFLMGIGYKF